MTTAQQDQQDKRAKDMLANHSKLMRDYDVTAGAPKAVVSGRIVDTEYEMDLLGIEYEPWVKASAYTKKWTMTETELVERIALARAVKADPSKRDVIRERADKDVNRENTGLLAQAKKRGVEVPA